MDGATEGDTVGAEGALGNDREPVEETPESNVDPEHSALSPLSVSGDKDNIDNSLDDSGVPEAIEAAGVVNDNEEESGFEDNNDEADDDSRCAHYLGRQNGELIIKVLLQTFR